MNKFLLTLVLSGLVLTGCKQQESDINSSEQSIKLSVTTLSVVTSETANVAITPTGFSTGATVVSSDPAKAIASIAGNNITITGVSLGEAIVTVTTPDTTNSAKLTVTVTAEVVSQSFTLSAQTATMEVDSTDVVTITPIGFATGATVVSSDTAKATVTIVGNDITITGVEEGDATITVTTPDNLFTATIAVAVTSKL